MPTATLPVSRSLRPASHVSRLPLSLLSLALLLIHLSGCTAQEPLECCSGGYNGCVPAAEGVPCASFQELEAALWNSLNSSTPSVTITLQRGSILYADKPLFFGTKNQDPSSYPKEPVAVEIAIQATPPADGAEQKPYIYCNGQIQQAALTFFWQASIDSILFVNCTDAPPYGGGAVLFDYYFPYDNVFPSTANVTNCEFHQNSNSMYISSTTNPTMSANYSGVLQFIGGGLSATVDGCLFQQNWASRPFFPGDYGYKGAGGVAIQATLSGGGYLTVKNSQLLYNGREGPGQLLYSTIQVWCTDYRLPDYNSAFYGECVTVIDNSALGFNVADVSPGAQVMCGNLQCSLTVSSSEVSFNHFFQTELHAYFLNTAPGPEYPCNMYPASVLFMSDYKSGMLNVSASKLEGNNATTLSMDMCGQNSGYAYINGSTFLDNHCGPCNVGFSPLSEPLKGGPVAYFYQLSSVEVYNSYFVNNTASDFDFWPGYEGYKGYLTSRSALEMYDIGEIVVDNSYFEGNSAPGGGAMAARVPLGSTLLPNVTISNTQFNRNAKLGDPAETGVVGGGAVHLQQADTVIILDNVFESNTAAPGEGGGAIFVYAVESLTLSSTVFKSNSASSGGAVSVLNTFATESIMTYAEVQNCSFVGNDAAAVSDVNHSHSGGALLMQDVDIVNMSNSVFVGNMALGGGGAAFIGSNRVPNSTEAGMVIVSSCKFVDNTIVGASSGGALYLQRYEDGYMLLTNSSFVNNSATGSVNNVGGALYSDTARNLTMFGVRFHNNTATQGGAVGAKVQDGEASLTYHLNATNCNFERNYIRAPGSGGAMSIDGVGTASLIGCTFKENSASNVPEDNSVGVQGNGGALVVITLGDSLEVSGCLFENNSAIFGGGMTLRTVGKGIIYNSTFRGNRGPGGAVQTGVGSSINIFLSTFEDNSAFMDTFVELVAAKNFPGILQGSAGGALYVTAGSRVAIQSCRFARNIAGSGGAIASTSAALEIDLGWYYYFCGGKADLIYTGNFEAAWGEYYALYTDDSRSGCNLPATEFISNTAYAGGAVALLDSAVAIGSRPIDLPRVLNATIVFQNNVAMSGGALSLLRNNPTTVIGAVIESNSADPALIPEPFAFPDNPMSQAMHASLAAVAGCGSGTGGGICIVGTGQSTDLQLLQNDTIIANKAIFGGGIYAKSSIDQCADTDWCWTFSLLPGRSLQCTSLDCYVNGSEVQMLGNEAAGGAGGAVFLLNRGTIHIWCPEYASGWTENLYNNDTNRDAAYIPCTTWTDNKATAGAFGPVMASSAVTYAFEQLYATTIFPPIEDYNTSVYNSADNLAFTVLLYDMFGQEYLTAADGHSLGTSVLVSTLDNSTLGQRQLTIYGQKGTDAEINGLRLQTHPGLYNLSFGGNNAMINRELPEVLLEIDVRECVIGEVSVYNFTLCLFCDSGYFSVDTLSSNCQACPDSAICNVPKTSGPSGVIQPVDLFFNSNPFSDQIHPCFFKNQGCSYPGFGNRTFNLTMYQATLINDPDLYNQTEYYKILCTVGHEGPLCGACSTGYGTSKDGCGICASSMLNIIYLVLMNVFSVFMITLGLVATLSGYEAIREGKDSDLDESMFDEATVPASLFKVMISYIQVITVINQVGISYPQAVNEYFSVTRSVTDVPGQIVSVQCALHDQGGVARPMVENLLNIFSPFYIGIFFAFFWVVWPHIEAAIAWVKMKIRQHTNKVTEAAVEAQEAGNVTLDVDTMRAAAPVAEGTEAGLPALNSQELEGVKQEAVVLRLGSDAHVGNIQDEADNVAIGGATREAPWSPPKYYWSGWMKRVVVSSIIIIFQMYQTVTDALFAIFVCLRIDDAEDEFNDNGTPNLAHKYGLWDKLMWQGDVRQVCYEGTHGIIAYVVGAPGIVLFAFAIPLGVAIFLRRNFDKLGEMDFFFVYGFLYSEYRPAHFYWESIIMLRKLAITAALNFMVNAEAVTVVLVMIVIIAIATLLHTVADPYSKKVVSTMETFSLYITMITLYLSLYLTTLEIGSDYNKKIFISCLIIIINIAALSIFIFMIVMYMVKNMLAATGVSSLELDENGRISKATMDAYLEGKYKNRYVRAAMGRLLTGLVAVDRGMHTAQQSYQSKMKAISASYNRSTSSHMQSGVDMGGRSWSKQAKSTVPVLESPGSMDTSSSTGGVPRDLKKSQSITERAAVRGQVSLTERGGVKKSEGNMPSRLPSSRFAESPIKGKPKPDATFGQV